MPKNSSWRGPPQAVRCKLRHDKAVIFHADRKFSYSLPKRPNPDHYHHYLPTPRPAGSILIYAPVSSPVFPIQNPALRDLFSPRILTLPKRPGSDYKPSHTEPPRDLATGQAAPSPLVILLETMRAKYADGDIDGAVALARIAAPYLHPRIPAAMPVADPSAEELAMLSDADLDALRPRD